MADKNGDLAPENGVRALLFNARWHAKYHEDREKHYENIDSFFIGGAAIFTVTSLLGEAVTHVPCPETEWLKLLVTAVISVLTGLKPLSMVLAPLFLILRLATAPGDKRAQYRALKETFKSIASEARAEYEKDEMTETGLAEWKQYLGSCKEDEPSIMALADLLCYEAQVQESGAESGMTSAIPSQEDYPNRMRCLLKHFWSQRDYCVKNNLTPNLEKFGI